MALFGRDPLARGRESRSLWAIVAAVAAGAILAGVAYIITRRPAFSVAVSAHASDGMRLTATCECTDDAGETVCRVTVRNTALREITSQARVDTREGSATSNEVSTTVPVLAKEVCLHIHVTGGDFVSAPKYEDGKTAAHVRADRELIVFLGNMKPSQERSLTVRARADQGVSQESNSAS